MEIEVRFLGQYAQAAGTRRETIEVDDEAILEDVVDLLLDKYGEPFAKEIYTSDGQLDVRISMGGTTADTMDELDATLTGEPIVIQPLIPPSDDMGL